MTWNYRVIAHTSPTSAEDDFMAMHEVYYDPDDKPRSYGVAIAMVASTDGVDGLRWQLGRMQEGLEKPVLQHSDFPDRTRTIPPPKLPQGNDDEASD